MNITIDKRLRTAAAVAVWVTLLALSQEAAAIRSELPACHNSVTMIEESMIMQRDTGAITLVLLSALLLIGILRISDRALSQPNRLR